MEGRNSIGSEVTGGRCCYWDLEGRKSIGSEVVGV
jgi:hypothetical protein